MARFLLPPERWGGDAFLDGEEARHAAQVLRLRGGERIEVFDGKGRRAAAVVDSVARGRVGLTLGEAHLGSALSPLLLAQAVPKGGNMEWIVRKAVELGVTHIQPLLTTNTVVRPGEGKSDKWRRIALEACKQCGQDLVPEIGEALAFREWIGAVDSFWETRVIASLAQGARPMREVLRQSKVTRPSVVLVGPEGDFTADETARALDAGFLPVSLGPLVLRVETAALYCLAAIRYEAEGE